MRKALLPMIASLALCGTATAALIVTKAHADQALHRPQMMAALASTDHAPPDMLRDGPPPQMRAQRRARLCKDMYAHKVGEMAFLETKLSLTPAQAPLFARWKDASLDIAKRHEGNCATRMRPARAMRASIVERMAIEEKLLQTRLADIDTERPALAALYGALTPAQKEEFGEGGMRRMAGRMPMIGHRPDMGPPGDDGDPGAGGPPPPR